MKKIISLFICATLIFALSVSVFALNGENYASFSSSSDVDIPANEHIGGDINGDGEVTFIDVVAMLRVTVGDVYNTNRHAHDANNDGEVSVIDVILDNSTLFVREWACKISEISEFVSFHSVGMYAKFIVQEFACIREHSKNAD